MDAVPKKTIDRLVQRIEAVYPDLPNSRWVALRLLEGDTQIVEGFRSGRLSAEYEAEYASDETEVS